MPRKDQRPCDDRNLTWSSDKGRFGYQMLEKMGWKEGKGLGAKEDGSTEHIKIKKRLENQGVGTETANPSRNWLSTSVAYESLLATLNQSYGAPTSSTTTGGAAPVADSPKAEETSKPAGSRVVGRPRKVLYSRMLRAKDLSNYSSEDKSAIFGGVPQNTTAPSAQEDSGATQQDVGSESEDIEERNEPEKCKEEKGEEEDEDRDLISGVTTTTSAVSMQDYFKMKMAEMAKKRAQAAGGDPSAVHSIEPSRENNSGNERKQKKKRKREEDTDKAKEEATEKTKKPKKAKTKKDKADAPGKKNKNESEESDKKKKKKAKKAKKSKSEQNEKNKKKKK